MKYVLVCTLTLVAVGCTTNPPPSSNRTAAPVETTGDTNGVDTRKRPGDWQDQVGTTVTLTGKAVNHKIGAFLVGEGFGIYVDLPDREWPGDLYHGGDDGEIVRVTGTVTERSDLPVFIPDPDTPPIQGIPMPEGTNLDEASKRYILESVEWERIGNGTEQTDEREPE